MRHRKARGFSILEVLISFTVLTVAILGLLGIMPAANKQGATSSTQSQALYLAEIRMDDMLAAGTFNQDQTVQPAFPWDPTSYIHFQTTALAGETRIQQARVEVVWLEQGRSRRVELTSLVYQ